MIEISLSCVKLGPMIMKLCSISRTPKCFLLLYFTPKLGSIVFWHYFFLFYSSEENRRKNTKKILPFMCTNYVFMVQSSPLFKGLIYDWMSIDFVGHFIPRVERTSYPLPVLYTLPFANRHYTLRFWVIVVKHNHFKSLYNELYTY